MNSHPQPCSRPPGFTLVELLTVIAIIAILMGLLFPAIGIVKEQARKAEAKTACTAIVAACKAYNTEYGKYPVLNFANGANPGDLAFGETDAGATHDNGSLFTVLRPTNAAVGSAALTYNPRRIVFFEGKDAKGDDASPIPAKGGFAPTKGSKSIVGAFYDPWGSQYNIILDADYDNVISIEPHTEFSGPTKGPQTGCVAFSFGKDNKLGSNGTSAYKASDDVISWQ